MCLTWRGVSTDQEAASAPAGLCTLRRTLQAVARAATGGGGGGGVPHREHRLAREHRDGAGGRHLAAEPPNAALLLIRRAAAVLGRERPRQEEGRSVHAVPESPHAPGQPAARVIFRRNATLLVAETAAAICHGALAELAGVVFRPPAPRWGSAAGQEFPEADSHSRRNDWCAADGCAGRASPLRLSTVQRARAGPRQESEVSTRDPGRQVRSKSGLRRERGDTDARTGSTFRLGGMRNSMHGPRAIPSSVVAPGNLLLRH